MGLAEQRLVERALGRLGVQRSLPLTLNLPVTFATTERRLVRMVRLHGPIGGKSTRRMGARGNTISTVIHRRYGLPTTSAEKEAGGENGGYLYRPYGVPSFRR
jgi:hypothetical protein